MTLNAVDRAQSESQLVILRGMLSRATSPEARAGFQAEIDLIEKMLAPPQVAPPRSTKTQAPTSANDKEGRFRVFYFCGGFYAAPPKNSPHWHHFVAAYGSDVADDPTIYDAITKGE